jgi:1,4-alpha-glucan branching enzyme
MTFQIIQDDPWLNPYEKEIRERFERFQNTKTWIEKEYGSLKNYASFHDYLGFHYDENKKGWYYREWVPAAEKLFLFGDFNDWNPEKHPLLKKQEGIWEIFLPDDENGPILKHQQKIKVLIHSHGEKRARIPVYISRAIQDPKTHLFDGQIWNPEKPFGWTDNKFKIHSDSNPIIYECHVGMAQEKEGVGTYLEFAENVLPRIHALGYNCIQMMAIQEHPYYGSFGYHVSNYFAPSSRFGTPEDLKFLINKAHELGIAVILDVIHSHAVKNIEDGLNDFDGSGHQYFHEGARGYHDSWDSKLFDYGKNEVRQFLLSNLNYWMCEFHFDGFRFDGVTSMLYHHHGHFIDFDHYDKYFKNGVDWDAVLFLQLANELIHENNPNALSIAEDMSGMPGLCQPIENGGVGFDYRLGMGIPDYWIKLLKHSKDEDWNIHEMWDTPNNRRYKEKTIAYAESHDQAMVGDKTTAFWLMDKEMYWHMKKEDENIVIERGIALHKMIRLFTIALGGEGYLNFIGNEFGHPEWIDFPREGNDWSYKYARRQWSLVDNPKLKYEWLNNFDQAMIHCIKNGNILNAPAAQQLNMDDSNKVIIFERGNYIFVFNFHAHNAIPDYRFSIPNSGNFKIVLNSDNKNFGGLGRVDESVIYESIEVHGNLILSIYLPNRTALVFRRE